MMRQPQLIPLALFATYEPALGSLPMHRTFLSLHRLQVHDNLGNRAGGPWSAMMTCVRSFPACCVVRKGQLSFRTENRGQDSVGRRDGIRGKLKSRLGFRTVEQLGFLE